MTVIYQNDLGVGPANLSDLFEGDLEIVGVADQVVHDHIIECLVQLQMIDLPHAEIQLRVILFGKIDRLLAEIDANAPFRLERCQLIPVKASDLKDMGAFGHKKPDKVS